MCGKRIPCQAFSSPILLKPTESWPNQSSKNFYLTSDGFSLDNKVGLRLDPNWLGAITAIVAVGVAIGFDLGLSSSVP